jgi:hypothetical protein
MAKRKKRKLEQNEGRRKGVFLALGVGGTILVVGVVLAMSVFKKDPKLPNQQAQVSDENKSSESDGLVVYFPFNGNTKDESGNGHIGVLRNGARLTTDAAGINNRAVTFDGVNDQLNYSFKSTIERNFTFTFWARPGATTGILSEQNRSIGIPGSHSRIRAATGRDHKGLIPYCHGGKSGKAGIGVNLGVNGFYVLEHAEQHLPAPLVYKANLTGWKHYAVAVQNNRPYLFVNGSIVRKGLQSTKTLFWSAIISGKIQHPGEATPTDRETFGVGFAQYGAYKGDLDELRVYNRTLSAVEIKALYEAEKPKK